MGTLGRTRRRRKATAGRRMILSHGLQLFGIMLYGLKIGSRTWSPTLRPIRAAVAAIELEHRVGRHRRRSRSFPTSARRWRRCRRPCRSCHEEHVERHECVLHPHHHRLLVLEIEQHAVIGRDRLAEHQPLFQLGLGSHHFDRRIMRAARGGDGEGSVRSSAKPRDDCDQNRGRGQGNKTKAHRPMPPASSSAS